MTGSGARLLHSATPAAPSAGTREKARGTIAGDTTALVATSALTAATGVVFWVLAARYIPAHELGVQTAVLSLVMTAGTLASAGPSNAVIAMIPATAVDWRRRALAEAGVLVAGTALAGGAIVAVVASLTLHPVTPAELAPVMVIGAVVVGAFAYKDAACTALSMARILPGVNLLAAGAKIGILALLVWGGAGSSPVGGTVAATLVSSALVAVLLVRLIPRWTSMNPPADDLARPWDRTVLYRFTARDGGASAITLGTYLATPYFVTWIAGPAQGALFALMLPIAQGVDFISTGASAALTKHLATTRDHRRVLRQVWAWVVGVCLLAGTAIVVLVPTVLFGFMGRGYDHDTMTTVLTVLVAGSVARASFVVWASDLRARLAVGTLLWLNTAVSLATVPVLIVFTAEWGAIGAALGLAVGSAVYGAVGVVALCGRLRRPGRHARHNVYRRQA
ncbi:MAG: hypothetical protein QM658_01445 [Gordonia sp. (in: high G+C Gram-positive bacteria)]